MAGIVGGKVRRDRGRKGDEEERIGTHSHVRLVRRRNTHSFVLLVRRRRTTLSGKMGEKKSKPYLATFMIRRRTTLSGKMSEKK